MSSLSIHSFHDDTISRQTFGFHDLPGAYPIFDTRMLFLFSINSPLFQLSGGGGAARAPGQGGSRAVNGVGRGSCSFRVFLSFQFIRPTAGQTRSMTRRRVASEGHYIASIMTRLKHRLVFSRWIFAAVKHQSRRTRGTRSGLD